MKIYRYLLIIVSSKTIENTNGCDKDNNNNNNNNNNKTSTRKYWIDVHWGIVSSHVERDPV